MDLKPPLEQVAEEYSRSPLDFNSEYDVQSRLYEATREFLTKNNELHTNIARGFDIHLSGESPQYASQYHDRLASSARKQELTRVRTELPIWHPLTNLLPDDERPNSTNGGEEILDLAVLRNPIDRPIHLKNGRHRIELEMIETAVEIKHPRDEPKIPATKRGSLDDLSSDEIQEIVNFDALGFKSDLEELEALGGDYGIDVYFIVTSQYDILRRGSQTNRRHRRLADAAVQKIADRCTNTSVIYAHPQGWEWLVEN